MQIFLAHMEMAYDEKNQAKIDQYAALFIEQVKKLHHTKEETEALACYAQMIEIKKSSIDIIAA